MNINMLSDTPIKNVFEHLILSLACRNVIAAPTRVTGTTATLLGLFVTNVNSTQLKPGVIISDLSDHNGIYLCLYKTSLKKKQTVSPIFYQAIADTIPGDNFLWQHRQGYGAEAHLFYYCAPRCSPVKP